MSARGPVKGADLKGVLQDLKSNRRVQVALVALGLMVWYGWPASGPAPGPRRAAAPGSPVVLGDRQSRELARLPDLAKLDKAGELPNEARLLRDLFQFEGAPPPPPPAPPPPPPPPPPTEEELAARRLAQERARESASRPALKYLGYLGTGRAGRLGAFLKGEESITVRQGDLAQPGWRLVQLTGTTADFQNLRFPDLKHRIEAVEPRPTNAGTPANEF
jgi:type IV secretory pathway VirB10-like protein